MFEILIFKNCCFLVIGGQNVIKYKKFQFGRFKISNFLQNCWIFFRFFFENFNDARDGPLLYSTRKSSLLYRTSMQPLFISWLSFVCRPLLHKTYYTTYARFFFRSLMLQLELSHLMRLRNSQSSYSLLYSKILTRSRRFFKAPIKVWILAKEEKKTLWFIFLNSFLNGFESSGS